MDYFLIKGSFHVVGYSPDGDSLMFEASNTKYWNNIQTQHREIFDQKLIDGKNSVQLRLQGIDALETHYGPSPVPTPKEFRGKSYSKAKKPKAGNYRQPEEYGAASTYQLLSYLGVDPKSIKWGSGFGRHWIKEITVAKGSKTSTYKKKGKDKIEGYIVVNDMDRKGRPIAWIFAGTTRTRNGARVTPSKLKGMLKESCNYKLVANGLVYPYFFMTLSASLRQVMIDGATNAQKQKMNIWSQDQSKKGFTLRKFSQLTNKKLIFPYLFRRLVKHQFKRKMEGYWKAAATKKSYKANTESVFLTSFFDDTNPYVLLVKEKDFVRLDQIVYVTSTKIKLKTDPWNIVFLS